MRTLRVLGLAGVFAGRAGEVGDQSGADGSAPRHGACIPGSSPSPQREARLRDHDPRQPDHAHARHAVCRRVGDRGTLYIHCVDATDPAAVVKDIQASFERRIQRRFR